jgi:hypothetical protein
VQNDMAELCLTVERVLACRQDLWSLPKDQRMRKATSMAMSEIHKAEVSRIRNENKPEDASVSPTPSTSPSGSKSSGDSSESVGTSCHSSLSGSADSIDRKDGFVASSPESNSDSESGALRPSRSTDFAVELRALKLFDSKQSSDSLMARYSAFAEKFI